MVRVFHHSRTKGITRLVLLVIANHETEGRGAFPSIDTIAASAACGERTVQEAITRAKKLGELAVDYRAGPNGTNLYRVLTGLVTEPLPYPDSRGVQNLHPADSRRESAPELKELGSTVLEVATDLVPDSEPKAASAVVDTNPNQPTHDQLDLARKLGDAWGQEVTPAAIVKLNKAHGRGNVTDALRSLRGFPPSEAVRKLYAYVAQIAADMAGGDAA
jgi:hypothetical protein